MANEGGRYGVNCFAWTVVAASVVLLVVVRGLLLPRHDVVRSERDVLVRAKRLAVTCSTASGYHSGAVPYGECDVVAGSSA